MNEPSGVEITRHLEAARTVLGRLRQAATAEATVTRDEVLARVQGTLDELTQLGNLLRATEAGASRVPCHSCGAMIMPAATMCGHCWRKRTPDTVA